MNMLSSWQTLGLLAFKPLVNFLFGQGGQVSPNLGVDFECMWIFLMSLALIPVAGFITFIATRRPVGPQPAAYGHMQTTVNLVDEWSTTMYWGHKAVGSPAHAGTSSRPLPPVDMDLLYASGIAQ